MIKRITLIFIALILAIAVPFYAFAATSDENSAYRTIDQIFLDDYKNWYGDQCMQQELTTGYLQYLLDETKYLPYNGGGNPHPTNVAEYAESYKRALYGDGNWTVSVENNYYSDGGSGINRLYLIWTEHNDMQMYWSGNTVYVKPKNDAEIYKVQIAPNDQNMGMTCQIGVRSIEKGNTSYKISNNTPYENSPNNITVVNNGATSNLFSNVNDITYPTGYTGTQVRTSFTPSNILYPGVDWSVSDRKVTAKYLYNITGAKQEDTFNITWTLCKLDNNKNVIENTCDISDAQKNVVYTHDVHDYGDFALLVHVYKPPPLLSFPEEITVKDLLINLKIDGSNFSGSTIGANCTDLGDGFTCKEKSPYEDCSLFGVDIVAGIGCHFRNFATALKNILIFLFVPSSTLFSNVVDSWTSKLESILAPLFLTPTIMGNVSNAFIDAPQIQQTSNCPHYFGNLFGHVMSMNPCYILNQTGVLPTIRIIINSGLVLALAVFANSKYRRIVG